MNYGVQRAENGGTAVRAICMLPALTGAWKHRGGGAQLSTSGGFAWNKKAVERPDLALASPLKRLARTVNMSALGQRPHRTGLRSAQDGPRVHALFVYNSNPGAVAPNHNTVQRRPPARRPLHRRPRSLLQRHHRLRRLHPARHHLPRTHRHSGRLRPLLRPALQRRPSSLPAKPAPTCGSFRPSGPAHGLHRRRLPRHARADHRQALAIDATGHSSNPGMEHITFDDLQREGHIPLAFHREPDTHPFQPNISGPLPTPSGKIEFYSETLAAQGLDPLPAFVPPTESRWGDRRGALSARVPQPQSRQLHELHLRQPRRPPQDGSPPRSYS